MIDPDYDARMTALINEHQREIDDKGAVALNFGAGATDTGIYSKTTLGALDTEINDDGTFTHVWAN
jgi:hypothetical protein